MTEEISEQPDSYARTTLAYVVRRLLHHGRPGDVQVNPWIVADELLQEHGAGDCARPSPPDILDVRDFALDQLLVLVRPARQQAHNPYGPRYRAARRSDGSLGLRRKPLVCTRPSRLKPNPLLFRSLPKPKKKRLRK